MTVAKEPKSAQILLMFDRILHVFQKRAFKNESEVQPALPDDVELLSSLKQLAAEEGRSVEDVIGELLWRALTDRYTAVEYLQPWEQLTVREKETAALACLGYTNHEIAELMLISANTVKTHVRHVLHKFNVNSKNELREVLAGWDFSEWLVEQNSLTNTATNGSDSPSSAGTSP